MLDIFRNCHACQLGKHNRKPFPTSCQIATSSYKCWRTTKNTSQSLEDSRYITFFPMIIKQECVGFNADVEYTGSLK